ncbi:MULTISPECIES: PHP domain-containing protein [unclassified Crossiella]|uniref:PHP domain-containing protein n=1 Tax=unclassified Crossiella TaxID=2620835 RepID=UPI001FFF0A98|nr:MULTISPECIES: PHP domain-containing protein [unclassified Crossiella]MCK2237270.1 PHP domain-containing protein [Crossiella sp. S99.2]MCK2250925.1 PHP domain-containing protein [Crossiella sp. S99.1]
MLIDLHAHTTASDGTDTPAELMAAASAAGLHTVAITDHDTTAGWAEAEQSRPAGLRVVRGAELSCIAPDGRGGQVTVHLLAYLFDPDAPAIVAEQTRLRAERRTRLRLIAERMAADGVPVDPDAMFAGLAPDASVGRPHLARVLVKAGLVHTVDEAFAKYLRDGGAYYLPRTDTPVRRAVEMIAAAGGVTVFAHPFARRRGPVVEAEVIRDLVRHGLTGVEVDHPDHEPADRDELRALAQAENLVITGSSDYHGTNKTVRLAAETTAPEQLEALVAKASAVPVLG